MLRRIERYKKKIALIICFCILFSYLPQIDLSFFAIGETINYTIPNKLEPIDASVSDNPNTEYNENAVWYTTYAGTEADPYIITTGLELENLSQRVSAGESFQNKHIKLVGSSKDAAKNNVIDLIGAAAILYSTGPDSFTYLPCDSVNLSKKWTPIGTATTPFQGHIYAADTASGIEVYNLSGYYEDNSPVGLFGVVGAGASIEGIHIKDAQIYSNKSVSMGPLAGELHVGASVSGCSSKGLTTSGKNAEGNPVSRRQTDARGTALVSPYYVPDFNVYAKSVFEPAIGGLIGKLTGTMTKATTFSGFKSENMIVSAESSSISSIGGIIGQIPAAIGTLGLTLENSVFEGKLRTPTADYIRGITGVGGIVGSNAAPLTINGAMVSGPDTIDSSKPLVIEINGYRAGGIVGSSEADSLSIKNIALTDEVSVVFKGKNKDSRFYQVGGVIGYSNDKTLSVENIGTENGSRLRVFAQGRIHSDNGSAADLGGVGGIVGLTAFGGTSGVSNTFTNCHTKISADIANYYDAAASQSYNNIYLGGIIGRAKSAKASVGLTVNNCSSKDGAVRKNAMPTQANLLLSVGGIVGGINLSNNNWTATNSQIINSKVLNWNVSADGLVGGLVGQGHSAQSANVSQLTNCLVDGFRVVQISGVPSQVEYITSGGLAGNLFSAAVTGCRVENTSFSFISESTTASLSPQIGGLIANAKNVTVTDCIANTQINMTLSEPGAGAYSGISVGGIIGQSTGTTKVEKTIGVIDFSTPGSITNDIVVSPSWVTDNRVETPLTISCTAGAKRGNYLAGGIIGSAYNGSLTVNQCISSGNMESIGEQNAKQSAIGGLVGSIDSAMTAVTLTNSFTKASLYGQLQDGIGGLVGVNAKQGATIKDCYAGGSVLNPWGGSVVGYTSGVAGFSNLSYDNQLSPKSACANMGLTASKSQVNPALWSGASAEQQSYYNAITKPLVTFSSSAAQQHVFSVTNGGVSLTDTDVSAPTLAANGQDTRTFTTAVGGSAAVIRKKIKFVARLSGHDNQNGADVPYTIATIDELNDMQANVASGGGFLGSNYNLSGDITGAATKPIGMAVNSQLSADNDLPFCGNFNGGAYTANITKPNTKYVFNGLFGYTKHATFTNLTIKYTSQTTLNANSAAGGLVGSAQWSDIEGVRVYAARGNGLVSSSNFGGIAGIAQGTSFNLTQSAVPVSFTGKLTGSGSYIGGIVGTSQANDFVFTVAATAYSAGSKLLSVGSVDAPMNLCYTAGDIVSSTGTAVGGLVGTLSASQKIKNSFMFGNVTGKDRVGGLVGELESASQNIISASYMSGVVYASGEYAGGLVGFAKTATNETAPVNAIANAYFAGQINANGTFGAASGNYVKTDSNFYFDAQLTGDIPVYGTKQANTTASLTGDELIAANMAGFVSAPAGGDYPKLTAFGAADSAISELSTYRNYNFTSDKANNANAFLPLKTITQSPDHATYSQKSMDGGTIDLNSIGVTLSDSVYISNNNGNSGRFKITANYNKNNSVLGGYTLNIDTRIQVTPFKQGSGTKDNPFLIPDVETFVVFRNYINNTYNGAGQYFKLAMGDAGVDYGLYNPAYNLNGYIYDFSDTRQNPDGLWNTSVGTKASPFMGTLDGNGKLLTNIKITASSASDTEENAGLFGYVTMASINNLTVEGGMLIDASTVKPLTIGMFAAYISGSDITNVTARFDGKTIADKEGFTYNSLDSIKLKQLNRYATVVGGFAGQVTGSASLTNCMAIGNIVLNDYDGAMDLSGNNYYIGGFTGYISAKSSDNIQITECMNLTDINDIAQILRNSSVGGYVGYIDGLSGGSIKIANCSSYGSVDFTVARMGGFVGGISDKNYAQIDISNCISMADVTNGFPSCPSSWVHTGGLIGLNQSPTTVNLTNCFYGGTIELIANKSRLGGIVGYNASASTGISGNTFDGTKNYDIPTFGVDQKQNNFQTSAECKITSALVDADGRYPYISYNAAATFGNEKTKKIAEQITLGQSTAMYVVRNTLAWHNNTDDYRVGASSVYTITDGATIEIIKGTSNVVSEDGRRIASKETVIKDEIMVQLVINQNGSDTLGGFGKTFTYHPNIDSIGRIDASYAAAALDTRSEFNIYTADQLMGLNTVLTAATLPENSITPDEIGGTVKTTNRILNANYTVKLGHDLNFDSSGYLNGAKKVYYKIVIGDETRPFKAVFDGDYHTISYNHIQASLQYTGLFAATDSATIKNTGITDASILAKVAAAKMGSFVGKAKDTAFINVFSSARLEYNNATPNKMYVGGIVGMTEGNCSITNSYFTGSIGPQAKSASESTVFNIKTPLYSGGMIGYISGGSAAISDSYVSGYIDQQVSPAASWMYGTFVGNTAGKVTLNNCKTDGLSLNEISDPVGNDPTFTVGGVQVTNGLYPKIAGFADTDFVTASRIPVAFSTSAYSMSTATLNYPGAVFSGDKYYESFILNKTASNQDKYTMNTEKTHLVRSYEGVSMAAVVYGSSQRVITMNLQCWYDNFQIVDGKKVYTVKTAAELEEFAKLVNNMNVGHTHNKHGATPEEDRIFANSIVQLGADVKYGMGIATILPVGADFAGIFDGKGYSIADAAFESAESYIGLFTKLTGAAAVKNLSFTGNTTVTISPAAVGSVYVGMIAGQNNASISGCFNAASITVNNQSGATVYIGGITGENASGKTITDCYNMGYIKTSKNSQFIGGIAGKNAGTLQRCYNTGVLSGYNDINDASFVKDTQIGGIAAANTGSVSTCYNAAVLENGGEDKYHPIAIGGTVSGCFFDGQVFAYNYAYTDSMSGTVYTPGTVVLSGIALSSSLPAGFSSADWVFTAGGGYYPMLQAFAGTAATGAQKNASYVSALATLLIYKAEGGRFDNFSEITLKQDIPVRFRHDVPGNQGSFEEQNRGNEVALVARKKGAATVELSLSGTAVEYVRKTIFANEETYTVRYKFDFSRIIAREGETSLRTDQYTQNTFILNGQNQIDPTYGSGSAGMPYLITTSADLDNFARYINNGGASAGRYFSLTRNIAYSGTAYTPIGTQANPFRGTFNGNGRVITEINQVTPAAYMGLFGYAAAGSTITLVGLENCTFSTPTHGFNQDISIGAIAGYTAGTVRNCYSRSMVYTYTPAAGKTLIAGGLVGDLQGSLIGSYARPYGQTTSTSSNLDGKNTLCSYVSTEFGSNFTYYGGLLTGKTSGIIDSCYHTAAYYTPVGVDQAKLSDYGIITGWFEKGSIQSTYYDTNHLATETRYLYLYRNQPSVINGAKSEAGNAFGWATSAFLQTEKTGTTDGTANDSAALLLSENQYLGLYEMAPQTPPAGISGSYSNNGYPILGAFDLLQYTFASFESSNIILNMQNIDASDAKIMNALCSYETADFPNYAGVLSKQMLNVKALSLPKNINYNVAAVAYGYNESTDESVKSQDIKWTVRNGLYTAALPAGDNPNGSEMVEAVGAKGPAKIMTIGSNLMPKNAERLYVYISLIPESQAQTALWGVHHEWDSAQSQEFPEESEPQL